jgi:hypothetical protein
VLKTKHVIMYRVSKATIICAGRHSSILLIFMIVHTRHLRNMELFVSSEVKRAPPDSHDGVNLKIY